MLKLTLSHPQAQVLRCSGAQVLKLSYSLNQEVMAAHRLGPAQAKQIKDKKRPTYGLKWIQDLEEASYL